MKDKILMSVMTAIILTMLWFGWYLLINPNEETGGFALVFMTPLLIITTLGALRSVYKIWAER